jgi:hypothetical protein
VDGSGFPPGSLVLGDVRLEPLDGLPEQGPRVDLCGDRSRRDYAWARARDSSNRYLADKTACSSEAASAKTCSRLTPYPDAPAYRDRLGLTLLHPHNQPCSIDLHRNSGPGIPTFLAVFSVVEKATVAKLAWGSTPAASCGR